MLEYLKEFGDQSTNPVDQAIGKMAEAGLIARTGKDIPFPKQPQAISSVEAATHQTSSGEVLPTRLEPIPFEIEIPEVSEEIYAETRRAVEAAIQSVFITPIRLVTMEILLAEDRQREQRGEPRRLEFVNESKTMRATLPPAMEVFVDPSAIRIEGSNYLSTDDQKIEIAKVAASYRERLPEALRDYVDWYMIDPSTMSQLEDAWMDAGNGLLLPNFFARTDVKTVGGSVAHVGRLYPPYQRCVPDWSRGLGHDFVFAVPVGVLPQKLVA